MALIAIMLSVATIIGINESTHQPIADCKKICHRKIYKCETEEEICYKSIEDDGIFCILKK